MRKLIAAINMTLDGFCDHTAMIADEEIHEHYNDLLRNAGTLIYGRITYQLMESYWPTAADQPNATKHDIEHSKWYKHVKKIVLSKTMKEENLINTQVISNNLVDEINKLKHSTEKEILLFGSPTAGHSLMAENLIDDYWLNINPVLLGNGIPVFKDIKTKTHLSLVISKVFSSGVVCLHYTRKT